MKDKTKAEKEAEAKAAADSAAAGGVAKPEPKDTENQTEGAGTATADQKDVDAQREQEAKDALPGDPSAADKREAKAEGKAQAEAAKPVVDAAKDEAAAIAKAAKDEAAGKGEGNPGGVLRPDVRTSDDPVQQQRAEEAADAEKAAAENPMLGGSKKERELLAAAPGGARTALTGAGEGSTTVSMTAASPRPASGPLDHPVTGIENYAASEDDPDNRVYADEAGPRDVFDNTEGTKAAYIDRDGNSLDFEDMFEDDGKTFVVTKVRVYEVFRFPNTEVDGKRLAYAAGKRVPRGEAENVRNLISVNAQIV